MKQKYPFVTNHYQPRHSIVLVDAFTLSSTKMAKQNIHHLEMFVCFLIEKVFSKLSYVTMPHEHLAHEIPTCFGPCLERSDLELGEYITPS